MKKSTAQMALEALRGLLIWGDRPLNLSEIYATRNAGNAAIAALEADLAQPVEPAATVSVTWYRGQESMENIEFELQAVLPPGTHLLYTAPPEPGGWQPIATAPKTGKESLFYTEEYGQVVMYWDAFSNKFETGLGESNLTLTHWMPLPPAPKDAS